MPGWRAMPFSEMGNSGGGSSVGVTFGGQIKLKGIWSLLCTEHHSKQVTIIHSHNHPSSLWRKDHHYPHFTGADPRQRGLSEFPKVTQLGNGRARISNPDWLAPESILFTISCNADSHQTLLRHLQLKILVGQLSDNLINNSFII